MPYNCNGQKMYLSAGTSSVVGALLPETVSRIVWVLFPRLPADESRSVPFLWQEDLSITGEEVIEAYKRIPSGKASGPDGIVGRVLKMTAESLAALRALTAFLKESRFSSEWKIARLILLKKPNKPDLSLPLYRPICLLSETDKYSRRSYAVGYNSIWTRIADNQFAVCTGRSIIDAI